MNDFFANCDVETRQEVVRLRKHFSAIGDTLTKARNGIQQADKLMEAAYHLGEIAKDLEMEDLDAEQFKRNLRLYVEDYLTKLEKLVNERKEADKL